MKNLNIKKSIRSFSLTSLILLFLMGSSQILFAQAADDDALFIDASGNVGIGNPSPLGPLTIGSSAIRGSNGFLVIGKHLQVGGGRRYFKIGIDDKFNFTIGDYGNDDINTREWKSPFSINYAAPDASFHIHTDGNVGIGTTTPGSYKLNVKGSVQANSLNLTTNLTATNGTFSGDIRANYLTLGVDPGKKLAVYDSGNNDFYGFGISNGTLEIYADGGIKMVVKKSGRVGIGTDAPHAKLHVNGSFMEKMDVIYCASDCNEWYTDQNGPVMKYFRNKLKGKPPGTFIKAIGNTTGAGWEGLYFEGWVGYNNKIYIAYNFGHLSYLVNP